MSNGFRLKDFIDWAERDFLPSHPDARMIVCEPTDHPAVHIDLDSHLGVSRLTFWDSGAAHLEIIPESDETPAYGEGFHVGSAQDFASLAEQYRAELRDKLGIRRTTLRTGPPPFPSP